MLTEQQLQASLELFEVENWCAGSAALAKLLNEVVTAVDEAGWGGRQDFLSGEGATLKREAADRRAFVVAAIAAAKAPFELVGDHDDDLSAISLSLAPQLLVDGASDSETITAIAHITTIVAAALQTVPPTVLDVVRSVRFDDDAGQPGRQSTDQLVTSAVRAVYFFRFQSNAHEQRTWKARPNAEDGRAELIPSGDTAKMVAAAARALNLDVGQATLRTCLDTYRRLLVTEGKKPSLDNKHMIGQEREPARRDFIPSQSLDTYFAD